MHRWTVHIKINNKHVESNAKQLLRNTVVQTRFEVIEKVIYPVRYSPLLYYWCWFGLLISLFPKACQTPTHSFSSSQPELSPVWGCVHFLHVVKGECNCEGIDYTVL